MGMGGMGMGGMPMMSFGMPSMGMNIPMMNSQAPIYSNQNQSLVEGKGKGKIVELTDEGWEQEFAKISVQDDKSKQDDLIDLTKMEQIKKEDEKFMSDLDSTFARVRQAMRGTNGFSEGDLAKWEAENGGRFADLDGDFDLSKDVGDHGLYGSQSTWTLQPPSFALSPDKLEASIKESINLSPYPFSSANPYLTENQTNPQLDPYLEGHRLLSSGATFKTASLAFEAAVSRDPGRAEAWAALGTVWAADEKEELARMALERAVDCGDRSSWMNLAISYVNEGQDYRALATLERWLQIMYPKIEGIKIDEMNENPWAAQDRLTEMFLTAARQGVDGGGGVDPDVQTGLGVLFYSTGEFGKARDCFQAALGVREDVSFVSFLTRNRWIDGGLGRIGFCGIV
jgi:peroxin-5